MLSYLHLKLTCQWGKYKLKQQRKKAVKHTTMYLTREESERHCQDDKWQRYKEMTRKGMMTHCMGVLVVSELRQCRTVLRLPGFGGPLTVTTLASLWVHAAVFPHAVRTASTAWRDVLLVCVCSNGVSSVLRQKMVRKWEICLPSHSLCCMLCSVLIGLTLDEMLLETKCQGHPYTSFTYTFSSS